MLRIQLRVGGAAVFYKSKTVEIEKYGILRKIILYCIILYDKVNTDYRLADSLLSEKGGLYGYL